MLLHVAFEERIEAIFDHGDLQKNVTFYKEMYLNDTLLTGDSFFLPQHATQKWPLTLQIWIAKCRVCDCSALCVVAMQD